MSIAQYCFPQKTFFGRMRSETGGGTPKDGKLLIVAGKRASESESAQKILDRLAPRTAALYQKVPAEPPLDCVDEIIALGREKNVQAVAAIGGGSVMDAAKAAAALIPLDGSVSDYFRGEKSIPGKGLFFAAAPTTAGTGAEATSNAVLTDPETKIKKSLRHPGMMADLALIDPELTLSTPPALTAASGLDAFVQAFESYTSPRATALTRTLSAEAVRKIFNSLVPAFREPDNLLYRTEMAEGLHAVGTGVRANRTWRGSRDRPSGRIAARSSPRNRLCNADAAGHAVQCTCLRRPVCGAGILLRRKTGGGSVPAGSGRAVPESRRNPKSPRVPFRERTFRLYCKELSQRQYEAESAPDVGFRCCRNSRTASLSTAEKNPRRPCSATGESKFGKNLLFLFTSPSE